MTPKKRWTTTTRSNLTSAVYIIGGLVDHNKYKNITYDKARADNIRTLRFPIGKYMKLKTSSILTVNQGSLTSL